MGGAALFRNSIPIGTLVNGCSRLNPPFGLASVDGGFVPLPVNHKRLRPSVSPGLFCPIMELISTACAV